jgi:hypothetical protein
MTTLQRNTIVALFAFTLFGCEETKPQQTTATTTTTVTTTTQTTRAVSLTIGMKASDAIALAGIPCSPATLQSINDGANVTIKYGGHSYVFSKGVLEAVH